MQYVAQRHPDWKCLIFGQGTARPAIEAPIRELGLEKNALLCDPLPPDDVPKMYAAAQIAPFVFKYGPITSSGLMEAMAAGKAIVVPERKGVREWAGDAGMYVAENDAALGEGINRLIEEPALRRRLGKRAREAAERKFSIKAVADQYVKLYERLDREYRGETKK